MLAPGISNSYRVKFMPDRNQDYHYQLKFATDSGDLIVPVVGEILGTINILRAISFRLFVSRPIRDESKTLNNLNIQ